MQWLDIVELEVRPGQFSGSEVLVRIIVTFRFVSERQRLGEKDII